MIDCIDTITDFVFMETPISRADIIVCKAFHARRAYMSYRFVFPDQIEFMVAPVVDIRDIRKDNWFTSEEKIRKVMSEVEKIGKYFSGLILSL